MFETIDIKTCGGAIATVRLSAIKGFSKNPSTTTHFANVLIGDFHMPLFEYDYQKAVDAWMNWLVAQERTREEEYKTRYLD